MPLYLKFKKIRIIKEKVWILLILYHTQIYLIYPMCQLDIIKIVKK